MQYEHVVCAVDQLPVWLRWVSALKHQIVKPDKELLLECVLEQLLIKPDLLQSHFG